MTKTDSQVTGTWISDVKNAAYKLEEASETNIVDEDITYLYLLTVTRVTFLVALASESYRWVAQVLRDSIRKHLVFHITNEADKVTRCAHLFKFLPTPLTCLEYDVLDRSK